MKATFFSAFAASSALIALHGIASAQDSAMQGGDTAAMELPAACGSGQMPAMQGMDGMQSMMEGMGEAQQAMMNGMMRTHGPMMQAMMAEDPDVAFACAMIPHHQGAIEMAEVELQHGDSDDMKQMAQKIIDDQKREIEQLTQWIEKQAQ